MKKQITSVGFSQGGEKGVNLSYDILDDEGKQGEDTKKRKKLPHSDFETAMENIKPHLLMITEFLDAEKFKKVPTLAADDVLGKNFRVCGIHISGENEKKAVIITGYHTLKTGLGYVFNTPLTKVNITEGETKYKFNKELLEDVDKVCAEALAYLQGKHGVKKDTPELPLFDGGQPGAAGTN